MYRSAAWGLAATLLIGALGAVAADPVPADEKPGLVTRWLGGSSKKPDSEKTFADVAGRPPVVLGPLEPGALAEALRAEQDAWQRRMEVCLKLRQIAVKLDDESLAQQADELERQATSLYHQRTARLGVKAGARSPAEVLDRSARSSNAVPISVAPPQPAAGDSPPQLTRTFREVKP
jgi:hypothetical protein